MTGAAFREGGRAWKPVNYGLLQAAWFGCVLGAAGGATWIAWASGALVLAVHFALVRDRRADIVLVGAAVAFGLVTETISRGVRAYDVPGDPFPWPLAPSWIVLLWAVFATTLRHCMAWMRGRLVVAALFGAVGGPLSLSGGAKLGAVEISADPLLFWGVVGAQWALAMPVLVRLAARVSASASRP